MKRKTTAKGTDRYIRKSAEPYLAPDGETLLVVSLKATVAIANDQGISVREVEIAALEERIVPRRYLRNMGTIGVDGQIRLLQSTVAVVGAGGLGSTAVELLARQGIGHLIIIDNDRFTESDLNRQIASTEENLGEYKVTVAARRVRKINSATIVTAFRRKLTKDNARSLLSGAHLAVDGLDNLPSRLALEQACRQLSIPYVHGAVAGFGGQLMTVFPEDAGLSSLYESSSDTGIETRIGNPTATPATIATLQVQEVVKIITGVGTPVRNRLLLLDIGEFAIDGIELGKY